MRQFFGVQPYRGTVRRDWSGSYNPLRGRAVAVAIAVPAASHMADRSAAGAHHLDGAGAEGQGGSNEEQNCTDVHDNSVFGMERPDPVGHYAELVRMYILYHIQPVCQAT